MVSLLQRGMTMPVPLASAGQIAPKIQAEARRRSLSAEKSERLAYFIGANDRHWRSTIAQT